MIKKILLTIFISLLMLNCSATITDPNPEKEINIGDGSFIDPTENQSTQPEEIIITDQAQISEFIKNHNGTYYSRYEDNSLGLRYIIDGDLIYNGYGTKVEATMKTLVGNKLQIYIEGKPESPGINLGYDMNDEMYTFNFGSDGNIYLFANAIFHKENYQKPTIGYETKIGDPISELITYSGNYYYYDYDDTKKYYILIDTAGQVYMDDNFKINYSKAELSNNVLIITYKQTGGTSSKQELHFYNKDENQDYKLIFGNTWINNQLQYETLTKYNLFSPYSGTYKSTDSSTTLTITTTDAQLNTVPYSYTPVIIGNTLTIYQYSSREGTKEHKFVFNDDKSKAVYTKPDGTAIELNRY
ncbi:hypothetical protein BFL38_06885 [Brachyspira hampsonii]|uniref:Uncharacterized protein n=1 Tax=Brachyspira hampsonii TaxID=1287055 RepID=A0A1E5NEJ5_9SPIR|nr:hypothetical protein [Brachyspira hampsonii]OEJ14565.1 hypothetical protein BFL38_06885 [Brachyspira hampsonii]